MVKARRIAEYLRILVLYCFIKGAYTEDERNGLITGYCADCVAQYESLQSDGNYSGNGKFCYTTQGNSDTYHYAEELTVWLNDNDKVKNII